MEDVQNRSDERGIALERVGVSGLRYPIVVLDRSQSKQQTVADLKLSVALPAHIKGTHMSRFVEVLNDSRGEVTIHTIPSILRRIREHLEADAAQLEVNFPYFIEKQAPVSGASSLMDYECRFDGTVDADGERFTLTVRVPVTSLCPCSKAISDYGAHNQRGYIELSVRTASPDSDLIWIEELVELAESSGSSPVYPLLKRSDERHVTMAAYDNPVFVEDMVRNAAARLKSDFRVVYFRVRAENDESIHNHMAFAETSWSRPEVAKC